jgi:hypothetical protein
MASNGSVGWESVIGFGIGSAPKWCSRQAEFRHILSRRSPCGLAGEMSEARVERRLAAILAVGHQPQNRGKSLTGQLIRLLTTSLVV